MSLLPVVVVVDLSTESESPFDGGREDRRRLYTLERCPDGARVRLLVGSRLTLSTDAVSILHAAQQRLDVQIEGTSPEANRTWFLAAATGELHPGGMHAEEVSW